ncbi:hypothetical protein M6B22_07630 [Jatrophihabitans cynanchi]|uniref:Uncharacterized protein n=1 Tax=Jatrophihabitans cynanchi TaxID=2944128 RepID=A0ABY7K4S5_9ACTN|nr:hypothetical protein [Jatrophihabitans sp. SB3-54]WAX58627.1 hypothetical protein M6B22_07630 [Jatrophihabitans sp. SB3-54]
MAALATAKRARTGSGVRNGAAYPKHGFATALKDLAAILRAELQVATVDVGGWDTHTDEAWTSTGNWARRPSRWPRS